MNTYAYTSGNPISFTDPFGLCKCEGMGKAPSPQAYAKYGQKVGATPAYIGPALFLGFRRGGTLDAQVRYGGSPAYANYVFGVTLSAAGYELSGALTIANDYGATRSSYGSHIAMDSKYTSIPHANVVNITAGYNDQKNGTLCTP